MAKAAAKPQAQCKPADHCFIHVETTSSSPYQNYNMLGGSGPMVTRTFKLFCSKCGEVRTL